MCSGTNGVAPTNIPAAGAPMFPNQSPPPSVTQSKILLIGVVAFLLAYLWPPLILLAAYFASVVIPYSFRISDDPVTRRKLWREFEKIPDLPEKWRETADDIIIKEEYWANARGMCLSTSTIRPKDKSKIRGVVCLCHGILDNASFMKRVEYQRFVREGIAVATIEYEGHGRSDGELGLIPSFDALVGDASSFFKELTEKEFPGKKRFLVGESMGGAVSFLAYKRDPKLWSGVIFVAPMCKISESMLPPPAVVNGLMKVVGPSGHVGSLGALPVSPAKADLKDVSFRVAEKRDTTLRVPTVFGRNLRLATSRELLLTTKEITANLKTFDAPFLIQHGKDDKVTDPALSQALYDESMSKDKEIKLYEGMWHNLTSGESDENIDRVFHDAVSWVLARI